MGWYYARQGQQNGPVSDTELAQLVAAGTVTAATLVWQPGMPAWKTYGEVSGIATAPDGDSAVCAVSGKIRPKREMLQYEGRWVSAEHRDEFFQRLREGVPTNPDDGPPVPGPYGYAGFWIRFLAYMIDSLCLAVVILPLVFGFIGIIATSAVGNGEPNVALILLGYAILIPVGVGLALGFDLYFIRKHDATPGKRVLGLKVFRTDGSKLSRGRIVGRFFSKVLNNIVPLRIGYIMAGFDSQKRSLHDYMCDTRVIKTRP